MAMMTEKKLSFSTCTLPNARIFFGRVPGTSLYGPLTLDATQTKIMQVMMDTHDTNARFEKSLYERGRVQKKEMMVKTTLSKTAQDLV
jgi:hypothetical protein